MSPCFLEFWNFGKVIPIGTTQGWICFSCGPLFFINVFFGLVQSPHVRDFLFFCLFYNLCVNCVCKNDGATKVENKKVFNLPSLFMVMVLFKL
jgi:hypothetical protein